MPPGFVAVDSPSRERPVGERGDEWHAARSEPRPDRASNRTRLEENPPLARHSRACTRRPASRARARVPKSPHAAAQRRGCHEVPHPATSRRRRRGTKPRPPRIHQRGPNAVPRDCMPRREVRELTFWSRRGAPERRGARAALTSSSWEPDGRFRRSCPCASRIAVPNRLAATVALSSARASSNAFLSLWNEICVATLVRMRLLCALSERSSQIFGRDLSRRISTDAEDLERVVDIGTHHRHLKRKPLGPSR